MNKLDLGAIAVPLDQYASQGNAVLGIRGSGKSYTATYVAERLLDAGIPIVAFDPIGIWRFLRVPVKGREGYKVVVAGGQHGDIPLPANGAAEIMRAAMRDGVSLVFDLYDISLSKNDWRRVVESAIKVLLYENKAHGLRHIFLEEAAEFCPQKMPPGDNATASVYSAVERLARMGGNAQLGYTLINQRAEDVNKSVLELCDLLILHRQKGRNSLTALGKWLDVAMVKGKIAEEVPALANGEAYVWPAGDEPPAKTKIPAKRTFHPDRKAMQAPATIEAKTADVSAFVATMRTSLEALTREAQENDPKALRAEITRLRRELQTRAPSKPDERELDRAYIQGQSGGVAIGRLHVLHEIEGPVAALLAAIETAKTRAKEEKASGERAPATPLPRASAAPARPMPAPRASQEPPASPGAPALAAAQRKILNALAFLEGVGITVPDKTQVSLFAGLSPTAGHTANMYGGLRTAALIEYPEAGRVVITDAGRRVADPGQVPQTAEEMQQFLMAKLAAAQRKILTVLIDAYPNAMDKREASERAGLSPDAGHTANMYGGLRSLGLIDYPTSGRVVALPVLFLHG